LINERGELARQVLEVAGLVFYGSPNKETGMFHSRRLLAAIGTCAVVFVGNSSATANPIQLTEAQFAVATTGSPTIVETFESFSVGTQPEPFVFANGSFSITGVPVPDIFGGTGNCGSTGKCLGVGSNSDAARDFSAFPAATVYWSTDIFFWGTTTDTLRATVVGASGTSVFDYAAATPQFVGFGDPLGLISVSFTNMGPTVYLNYTFDNVTTAASSPVPEPVSSLVLLGMGLAAVGVQRFRLNKPAAR
jgi:hypothetical protein